MMVNTIILPVIFALLLIMIIALCFVQLNNVKFIRRMAIMTVTFVSMPILSLFIKRVLLDDDIKMIWSAGRWTRSLLSSSGDQAITFSVTFVIDTYSSWLMIIVTAIAITVVMLGFYIKTRHKSYYIFVLLVYLISLFIVTSNQMWISILCLMLMSFIIFIMSGIWSKSDSYSFATRFMFIQTIGFVFIILGTFILQFVVFDQSQYALSLSQLPTYPDLLAYLNISQIGYRNIAFICLMAGIACLMPLVGLHRPIIDLFKHVHYHVLLVVSGLYLPLMAYFTMKYLYVFFIDYIANMQFFAVVLCVIQIGFMAINLWKVKYVKHWTGYVVLSIIPIIYILLVSNELVTVSFALMAIISTMLTVSLLLSIFASLNERQPNITLEQLKGQFSGKPYLASIVVLTLLAVSGLPIFSHYFTIFHTFYAVYDINVYLFIINIVSVFLVAINVFLHMSKLFIKTDLKVIKSDETDLRLSEIVPHIILISLIVVLGIYPSVFLQRIEIYTDKMLSWLYQFKEVVIGDSDVYWSLLIGDSIRHNISFTMAAISVCTLIGTMVLASKQKQKMLHWVLWTASHFASIGLAVFVVTLDFTQTLVWQQFLIYCVSVLLIYIGTHFLLSRHMYRSLYEDAIHYQGLYYKNRKMYFYTCVLIMAIIGLPFTPLSIIRFELIAQLMIERYLLLAICCLISFVFILRPLWYWFATITFPMQQGSLLNRKEQIEEWTWTKQEQIFVVSSISINTLLMVVYILL